MKHHMKGGTLEESEAPEVKPAARCVYIYPRARAAHFVSHP